MIPALKAEFRKLLTVRSTYVITGLALLAIGFVSLYAEGIKGGVLAGPSASLYLAVLLPNTARSSRYWARLWRCCF